jgi:F420-dependent oxidoreductase-like protein
VPESGESERSELALPAPCLVVLVGPSSSGKTTWAHEHFDAPTVVSTDQLRAVVGQGEDDLDASVDAFALADTIVEHRLGRGLTTVVDTLALDADRRASYRDAARRHDVPCVAVAFDITAKLCRERNRTRARPLPADVLTAQLKRWAEVRDGLDGEGFHSVVRPGPVRLVPARLQATDGLVREQRSRPVGLRFGLHVSAFPWKADRAEHLRRVATDAEQAGFDSLWVMDHVRQIPQVGRDWDDLYESYTTLAWLAAVTQRVRLGALVTAITFRNVAHLGKIVATLDVLSDGRAMCGLGAAWYGREHDAYGWSMPPAGERLDLLEDALQLLPLLWGPGAPAFEGRVLRVPEAICYPRPLQDHVPLLVGGGGERRTLRLAARYADACNVQGDAATVAGKVDVLRAHCKAVDRDPSEVEVTHLAPTLLGDDRRQLDAVIERFRPRRVSAERFAAQVNAGTVDDQIGRFRRLADLGVGTAIVSLPDLDEPDAVARWAPVLAAFA